MTKPMGLTKPVILATLFVGMTAFTWISGCGYISISGPKNTTQTYDGIVNGDHRIFVSSTMTTGDLGGFTGADRFCTSLARSAGLVRNYKAVLSGAGLSVRDRFSATGAVYIWGNGQLNRVVSRANKLWEAANAPLESAIKFDESGNSISGAFLHTGTLGNGDPSTSGGYCVDWSSSAAVGNLVGFTGSVSENWISQGASTCNNSLRIYCMSND